MFIVPVTGKISRRNLPFVTIGLILINCLVYFILQANDTHHQMKAVGFYFTSGLAEIELTRYIEYRNPSPDEASDTQDLDQMNEEELSHLFIAMRQDDAFNIKLRNEEIITAEDPEYSDWKQLKDEYEYLESKVTSVKYGFIPTEARPVTFLTHMFLHGGFEHLLGNMVFLWLVGCMIEMGSGRSFCGVSYILTGLGAVVLFWLMHPTSSIQLVGASGAIAGLMGAFCVLYGRKKVKFFYSLGVYFSYLKAPAIVLLPVWIAKEVLFLYLDDGGNVAYEAHIGGLISGSVLGLIGLIFFRNVGDDVLDADEPVDEIAPLIENALAHVSQLNLDAGSRLLEQALAKDPGHIGAMTHLFNIHKNNPQDPRFHDIARQLLNRLTRDGTHHKTAGKVFEDYTKLTNRPCLTADLYLRMISVLSAMGYPEKAEGILAMILKQKPDLPGIPTALMKLAGGYRQKGITEKYQRCLNLLGRRYPNSAEGQIALNSSPQQNQILNTPQ